MPMREEAVDHPRSERRRRSVGLAALFVALGVLFVALGVWQIERRAEKRDLIAAVRQRVHGAPVAAPGPPQWARIAAATDAYRRVRVRGVFLNEGEAFVQAVTDLGPGFWVMTPLRTDAGWTVLVNRGFISGDSGSRSGLVRPAGEVTVSGLLRMSEPGGGFLHANDPARDRWYSRDVSAIGRARRLGPLAPYFIDAGPGPAGQHQPVGGLTVISFPDNHLQYALTWFALAVLSALGAARAWRGRRGADAAST
jgi:surfeit locus 1 family protein